MRSARSLVLAAEVALAAVTVATVVGMWRLFDSGSWLVPLVLHAAAAHAVAAALRRRGTSLAVSAAVMAVAAVLAASWTGYWSTTAAGLPTGDTWTAMGDDLSGAWRLYQEVVAPAPAEPGFVLASALALWLLAYIADWAAFRLWVPFEATLPAGTLFLFTALLGADRGRGAAVAIFGGTVIGFLLVHRLARQDGTTHWVGERRVLGQRWLLTVGGSLGAAAVLLGVVLGPSLPGAGSPGLIDPAELRDGDESRVTISPLVDIRSRLVDQADVELFSVQSSAPSYWRLTSLERFDGRIWSSSGSYGEAGGELPTSVDAEVETADLTQTFTISALAAIWLPSAYEPRSIDAGEAEVRYDEESATLIVDNEVPTSDGLIYDVTSASPRLSAEVLAGAAGDVPGDVRDRYLGLPDDLSPRVREHAAALTADAGSPYAAARAIQDHLRTFDYDLGVGAGHGGDALEAFLFETQRGYCEQFAGSFAALARAAGLPARVAVGFTQGERDPDDPSRYVVRGEHAHAWPEVFLAGAGWVPFEPTPGRGMPFAEDHTGVTPAQAAADQPGVATTAPPTTTAPGATDGGEAAPPTSTRQPSAELDTGGAPAAGETATEEPWSTRYLWRPLTVVGIVLAALVVALGVGVPASLAVQRLLRRRSARTPSARIELAWQEAVDDARVVGYEERPSDTHRERAAALAAALPTATAEAAELADRLDAAAYAADDVTDADAEAAAAAAAGVGAAVRAVATRQARLARWFDPRPALRAWRAPRRAAHRKITTTARGDLEVERELVGSTDRR